MQEFHQHRGHTVQVWRIERHDNVVTIQWGQQDGKMQETRQSFGPINIGKANEKTSAQVAQEYLDRMVLRQTRRGYATPEDATSPHELDLRAPSSSIRFWKPQHQMSAALRRQAEELRAWYLRKRDGTMFCCSVVSAAEIYMWPSTMLPSHKDEPGVPWTARFPQIVRDLKTLVSTGFLPEKSLLLGEVCCFHPTDQDGHHVDSRRTVQGVIKSLTPRALELQTITPLGFCCWDIAAWEGDVIIDNTTYQDRWHLLDRMFNKIPSPIPHFCVPELLDRITPAAAMEVAVTKGWEGFVVVDPMTVFGERAISFNGRAERPAGAAKLKRLLEADFIARYAPDAGIGARGKGKKANGIGSVFLYLFDPKTQKEVFISRCGGGLTDQNVTGLSDPALYPMVWEVRFSGWTENGSLDFPQFIRRRDDKTPQDCGIDQRP